MSDTGENTQLRANSSGAARTRISFVVPDDADDDGANNYEFRAASRVTLNELEEQTVNGDDAVTRRRSSVDHIIADAEIDKLVDDIKEEKATRMKSVLLNSNDDMIDKIVKDLIDEEVDGDKRKCLPGTALCALFMLLVLGLIIGLSIFLFSKPQNAPNGPPSSKPAINQETDANPPGASNSPVVTLPPMVATFQRPINSSPVAPVAPPNASPWALVFGPQGSYPPTAAPSNVAEVLEIDDQVGNSTGTDGSQSIGFIDSPMDLEELLLLVKTHENIELSANNVDDSQHVEVTTADGDILHCGIEIASKLVLVECKAGQELCDVYRGGIFTDQCDDGAMQ